MAVSTYGRKRIEGAFDAIVIGSGIGGIGAAALLAMHGDKRVLVLERHYTPGGFTHVFRRPGYEWDVGVHYVGEVNDPNSTPRRIFDHLSEGRLQWNPMPDVYDRVIVDGREYEFVSGQERLAARMKGYFPGDARAVDRYFAEVRRAVAASRLFFTSKALPWPLEKAVGGLMRSGFMRYASRTTAQMLDALTDNRLLAAVLTAQWGDYGLPPASSSFGAHALVADHYLGGAAYPVGGAGAMLASILPVIERNGGVLLTSAEVKQIRLDSAGRACGVEMADGGEFRAPLIISDAGAPNTYGRLLPREVAQRAGAEQLWQVAPSVAHVGLYVGLRHSDAELGLDGANRWIFPSPNHDENVARAQADPNAPFPALFISFPSAKDPQFQHRYPGRATMEVVAPIPYSWFERWSSTRWKHRGAEYDDLKGEMERRLRSALELQVPAVRGRIDYCELSTPLSTRHFGNFAHGEIYGLSATPARFALRCLGPRTAVPGLYLTGADTVMCGVAGALAGGVLAASTILGRNLMRVARKGTAVRRAASGSGAGADPARVEVERVQA